MELFNTITDKNKSYLLFFNRHCIIITFLLIFPILVLSGCIKSPKGNGEELANRVNERTETSEYSEAVEKTATPDKPDIAKIIEDIKSEKISEGFPKDVCWFHEDQRWTLDKYDIHNFTIEDVLCDTEKEYIFIATMRLKNDHNAFDAKVKISYTLTSLNKWEMEFINSLGVTIVQTHKYDDLVSFDIEDDGWGGVKALFVTNKSNLELVVGVDYMAGGERYRKSLLVSPEKKAQFGGTFYGGSVTSYEVGFIERY